MIRSSRDKDAEAIWGRRYVKKLSPELSKLAYNKLVLVNAAESINDLRVPPGNRLEKLAGSPAGQYSVRVNDQWRICFPWSASGAGNVELVDERRSASREARRARGQSIGRPKALDQSKVALAQRMYASGESASTIATTLGVSRATVYRVLADSPEAD